MTLENSYLIHKGKTAVIFGKGPSLDLWLAGNKRLPCDNDNIVTISISSAGICYPCDYNVTRHNRNLELEIPGTWVVPITDGWELSGALYQNVRFKEPPPNSIWYIPIQYPGKMVTREYMRDCNVMITPGGSCVNAIMFAHYVGVDNILFIGVDGVNSVYANNFTSVSKCYRANMPGTYYDKLREQSDMFANMLFKDKFKHWTPDLK